MWEQQLSDKQDTGPAQSLTLDAEKDVMDLPYLSGSFLNLAILLVSETPSSNDFVILITYYMKKHLLIILSLWCPTAM